MTDDSDAARDPYPVTAGVSEDRFAVEVLDLGSCWAMLRANSVGRIAACVDGHPQIFPVTYVVDGESIVFRTASGTKAVRPVMPRSRSKSIATIQPTPLASSVIVAGTSMEIVDADEWDHAQSLPLFPWLAVPMGHFVRVNAGVRLRQALPSSLRPVTLPSVEGVNDHAWRDRGVAR